MINNVRLPRVAPSSHCERNEEACSSVKSLMLQLAIFNVSSIIAGDKVLVHTERGVKAVTVAVVKEYAGNEPEPLRMVINVKQARRV